LRLVDNTGVARYYKGIIGDSYPHEVIGYHEEGYQESLFNDELVKIDIQCADIKDMVVYLDEEASLQIDLSKYFIIYLIDHQSLGFFTVIVTARSQPNLFDFTRKKALNSFLLSNEFQ
jgi:hypothetical protein